MTPDRQPNDVAAQVWALSQGRLVAHWVVDAALWAAAVALPLSVVVQHPDDVGGLLGAGASIGFACLALVFAFRQLRAGVAVWIDPAGPTVTVYRAAGGPLAATPNQVLRIDRGRRLKADSPFSPASGFPPLRVVTVEGTVYLSPFLGPALDIAEALTAHNPRVQVDL